MDTQKSNHQYDVAMNSEIRAQKIDIEFDYISSECIDLDEELLRYVLSIERASYPTYTDTVAFQAVNRLLDNHNDYKVKGHPNKSQKKK